MPRIVIVCHTGPEPTQSLKHCLRMNYLQLNRSSTIYRQIAVKIAVGAVFLFKKKSVLKIAGTVAEWNFSSGSLTEEEKCLKREQPCFAFVHSCHCLRSWRLAWDLHRYSWCTEERPLTEPPLFPKLWAWIQQWSCNLRVGAVLKEAATQAGLKEHC